MAENIPFKKTVAKPWGNETIYSPEESGIVGKIIEVNSGKRLSLQYHDQKKETLCLLEGTAVLWIGSTEENLAPVKMELRSGYFIQPGTIHRIEAETDCIILEVSTPETGTTFRLEDDYSRPDETESVRSEPNRGWKG